MVQVEDMSLLEGNPRTVTNASFVFLLSAPSERTVSFRYEVVEETAGGIVDFVPAAGQIIFPPEVTNQVLNVIVNGDDLSESNETCAVQLSAPIGVVLGRPEAAFSHGAILTRNPPLPHGAAMNGFLAICIICRIMS